jgi:hypothetical protein
MANYGGGLGAGRTGPYWRRQLGTTLPGERTGAELAAINSQRARLGLTPLGGPTLHAASPVHGPGVLPTDGRVAIPEGPPPGVAAGPATGAGPSLTQLLALKAMFAQATGQQPSSPAPPSRGVLPQLHRTVQVRPHTRVLRPASPIY